MSLGGQIDEQTEHTHEAVANGSNLVASDGNRHHGSNGVLSFGFLSSSLKLAKQGYARAERGGKRME